MKPWPSVATVGVMTVSFLLLSHALKTIPVGIATGIGAVGTVIVDMALLGEPRDAARMVCILLILNGILGLKLFSPH